jgi:hypothetical protein
MLATIKKNKTMVTFKQVARSYTSAVKAAEREQKRQAREAARLYKEQQKQQEITNAAETVKRYEEYIDVLMSIHKNCTDKIDWQQIQDDPEPPKPVKQSTHENAARQKLDNFKPSFFDKIFGSKKKIQALEQKVEQAKAQDLKDFETAKETYEDWQKVQAIAKGVQVKDPQAYADALNYFEPFSDISDLGSKIQLSFEKDFVEIGLHVNNSKVIPNYVVSQTRTGKLSQKDMPKGKFNELYQDYVCGGLLRIARETLAYLPVQMVAVHAMTEMVNTTTGHLEEVPIVSAILPPETMDKLNFETLDPSDSMQNFVHNMKFSKTNGFSQVDKVDIKEIIK